MTDLNDFVFEPLEADWQEGTEEQDETDLIKDEMYSDNDMNESEESEKEDIIQIEDICDVSTMGSDNSTIVGKNLKHKKVRNVLPKISAEEDLVMNSMVKICSNGMYLCNYNSCQSKTKSKNGLIRHIKVTHLNLISYSCTQCDYTTKFAAHVLGVHEKVRHSCKFCDYKSTHKTTIYHHIRRVHGNEEKRKCPECDYKTARV